MKKSAKRKNIAIYRNSLLIALEWSSNQSISYEFPSTCNRTRGDQEYHFDGEKGIRKVRLFLVDRPLVSKARYWSPYPKSSLPCTSFNRN